MKRWNPVPFLGGSYEGSPSDSTSTAASSLETALIVINTPIIRRDVFATVWKNASIRYCADGGANRVYDAFGKDDAYVPDLIKGDLDSLRDDVRQYYASKGVPVERDGDQYATDLGKCIKALEAQEAESGKIYQLVVYGGLSGRLDQTAHTLHALYKLRREREWAWIVSEESLTCVLDAGSHELYLPHALLGKTCGILPVGVDSAQVTTTGLEWNLDDAETSFDTLLSTSNHLVSDAVTVMTNKPVVWTAELRAP